MDSECERRTTAEILAQFEDLPTVEEVNAEMRRNLTDWNANPEQVAAYLKAQLVEDIYAAMEEQGLNRAQLAKRLGESRQYVTRVLNEKANFTLETVAKLACVLNRRVAVRMYACQQDQIAKSNVSIKKATYT